MVGRYDTQNDELTGSAIPGDLWFHVYGHPGSHVLLRGSNGNMMDIREAAQLAARYSAAEGTPRVEYCKASDVKKIPGSPAGEVIACNTKLIRCHNQD